MNSLNFIAKFILLQYIFSSCVFHDKNGQQGIEFYYRRTGDNNRYETIFDEFKITNYSNRTVLASTLYKFAVTYVDTVHLEIPVSGVTFVGESSYHKLPLNPVEDPFEQEHRNTLIGFYFINSFPNHGDKRPIELESLVIYKDNGAVTYEMDNSAERVIIDSILNSKKPFESDF